MGSGEDTLLEHQPVPLVAEHVRLPSLEQAFGFVPSLVFGQRCDTVPAFLLEHGSGDLPVPEPLAHPVALVLGERLEWLCRHVGIVRVISSRRPDWCRFAEPLADMASSDGVKSFA